MNRLKGENILVTGSGRGFGRSMAVAYAVEGAHVVSTSRTLSELKITEEYILEWGGEVSTVVTDLVDDDSIAGLCSFIEDLGGVDVIVNNAATSPWKVISDMTNEDWDRTLAVNLRAPFVLAKRLYTTMSERGGGSIINISSRSAQIGFMAELAYCSSKYGLEGLTQCLALELKPYNIAVNSLNVGAPPGFTLKPTELTEKEAENLPAERREKIASVDSMVTSFRDAWVFLARQRGNMVTGQRFSSRELARLLETWAPRDLVTHYKGKLLEAVYQPIAFPDKVKYQTRDGGWRLQVFR
jgi:NAD(P)-dependent dehydrogenase (short-subunit alcohol dehydrogenase family)